MGLVTIENNSRVSPTLFGPTFGNEDFYKKLGYRKHKTAFALFSGESDYVE